MTVQLHDAGGILLRITDDGDGFDPAGAAASLGFGLISMRERIESLGGDFQLRSETGCGTTVEVRLP